ncbi:MAG: ribokinase [Anaerolineaceae bacterium]|nr:ribokinase [Anaerolineaceae bacterium]
MKALNFGSLNLDYVYQVAHFVQPGETLSAFSQAVFPGGKGLNQSVALAKAGAETWHAGCLGQGGEMLERVLLENGVKLDYLMKTNELQGNAVIQVNPEGQNCILLFGGSNRCVTAEQISETFSHFDAGDYLILQNEVNALPEIVSAGYERGMKIVLNPSPYNELIDAVDLSKISWLLVNEVEAEQLSGSDDPEVVWSILHERYPKLSLLVTLGSRGSIAFTESETVRQGAFPVKAVDTTGAGDTYTGFFAAGLMEGRSLADCLCRASLASSISVTRPGAASSIPDRSEVEQAAALPE